MLNTKEYGNFDHLSDIHSISRLYFNINLTENQLRLVRKYLNNTAIMEFTTASPDDIKNVTVSCGGQFEYYATLYSDNYHAVFSIIVCIFGTISNVLNIIVLTRKDMVCAPINRILTALATVDCLVMIEYIPFVVYYDMFLKHHYDFPYLGAVFMMFHMHFSQVLHTMSICMTLTLAIWRYLAIEYPDRNHVLCSESRCQMGIALSYIIPIILCIPSYTQFKITDTVIIEDGQDFTLYHLWLNDLFLENPMLLKLSFWMYGVFIKLLPCCILTIISLWLIRVLFRAKKRKQVLRAYVSTPLSETDASRRKQIKSERRADRTTKMLIAVLLLFLLTEFPQGIISLVIGMVGGDFFLTCYQRYGAIMDILALLNGSINFILYCCMNRMFRATFGKLFKHKIMGPWRPAGTSDEVHSTYVLNTHKLRSLEASDTV